MIPLLDDAETITSLHHEEKVGSEAHQSLRLVFIIEIRLLGRIGSTHSLGRTRQLEEPWFSPDYYKTNSNKRGKKSSYLTSEISRAFTNNSALA